MTGPFVCIGIVVGLAAVCGIGVFIGFRRIYASWERELDPEDRQAANIVRAMILVVGRSGPWGESDIGLIQSRVFGFCGGDLGQSLEILRSTARAFVAPTDRDARADMIWQLVLLTTACDDSVRAARIGRASKVLRRALVTAAEFDQAVEAGFVEAGGSMHGPLPAWERAALHQSAAAMRGAL